ncbi:MAG: zinc-binding dehydrogenase [Opitutaceae bacterium]
MLDYAIAELAAISGRGVTLATARPGESAVVIGQGLIGMLSAASLIQAGCGVTVADIHDGRLERSRSLGVTEAVNVAEPSGVDRLLALCPDGVDIVVEASGTFEGLKLAHRLIKRNAAWSRPAQDSCPRLVLQSSFKEEMSMNPANFFAGERLLLLTPSDRGLEDRQRAIESIRMGRLNPEVFIHEVVPYHAAPDAYRRLRDQPNEVFSLIFDWGAPS